MESDYLYYCRRSDEERAAALLAIDRKCQLAHLELAARYAQRAASIRAVDEQLGTCEARTSPALERAGRRIYGLDERGREFSRNPHELLPTS